MWYIHTTEFYSATKRNEALIHAVTLMNLANSKLMEESQSTKDHMLYDFIYMRCPE